MQTNLKWLLSVAVVATLSACSDGPTQPPGGGKTKVELKITQLNPTAVYIEGGELVEVTTENACDAPTAKVVVAGQTIEIANFQKVADNKFSFTAPAAGNPNAATTGSVDITCAAHKDPSKFEYSKNTASSPLTFDPELEPQPTVTSYGPVGDRISVLAKMTVTFSRPMDPASITNQTVYIDRVNGTVSYSESTKTATFTPTDQLKYDETYTAIVKGGTNGVVSKAKGKQLKTRLTTGGSIDPEKDAWTFKTRKEGEGNPWIGDISAAAGISTGGSYKLFSVTGQPTPVGEAYAGTPENHTYKLEAGFIYATQPPPSGN